MKKFFLALAAIFSVLASAQVTYRPIIRAGVNFAEFTPGEYRTVQSYGTVSTSRNPHKQAVCVCKHQ